MLQTTEINPSRDCHLSLNSGPHIRVGAEKLPVFIHLKLDKVAKRFSSDLEEIFNSPYSFQIEDLDLNTNRTLKSELVNTIWPAKPRNVDSLFSSGIFWVKLDNPVRVKSKPFTLQQNNVVHLITHPFSQDVHLQSNSQYHMDNISCALVMPVVETPNHTPTTEVLQSLCFSFFDGQLIEFDLTIAVNLRGRIDPPTEKVDVELYYKVPQTSQQFSPLMQHDHPSLLVDDVSKLEMESKGFNTSVTVATTQTDKHGVFSFRALPLINYEKLNVNSLSEVSKMYQISISKAGYKFDIINSTNTKQMGGFHWYIKSTKLSLVEVFVFKHPVLKDSRQPLPAVLISIIGEGHRANHLTNDDGVVRFVGLSPGQYYLRPMMKEYSFTVISPDPSESGQAIPVQVEEGKSAVVILSARRIAFSASGIVTSLAGIPEFGVLVEATWLPDPPKIIHNDILHLASANNLTCQLQSDQINVIPHEQSLTDSDGNFRIRGLMPGCAYMISVYTSPNAPTDPMYDHLTLDSRNAVSRRVVEHAIPGHVNFKMPSTDTNGFHFYVIRHLFTSTVTVSVQTSDSYLSTLHLVVFPVGHPENTVVKHEFGSDSLLFTLTGSKLAPMIGREYVIRLISDLKSSFYTDVDAQNIVFKPKSGVNEHYTFHFNPKLRNSLSD
ncbi:unnamed protein product [Heterobilharzia americana]|nr:unnamed protein product [Heterobilharzia americana]